MNPHSLSDPHITHHDVREETSPLPPRPLSLRGPPLQAPDPQGGGTGAVAGGVVGHASTLRFTRSHKDSSANLFSF